MFDILEGLPPGSDELNRLLAQMGFPDPDAFKSWEDIFNEVVRSGGGPAQTPTEGPTAVVVDFPVGASRLPGIYSGLPGPGVFRLPPTPAGTAPVTSTGQTTGTVAVPPPITYPDGVPSDPIEDSVPTWRKIVFGSFGDILGSLGREYIQARWGSNGFVDPGTGFVPIGAAVAAAGTAVAGAAAGVGLPWIDVISGNPKKGWCYDPHANNGAGAWVKRRRRRRRQLITPAEAGQLQTLMSIAGKSSDITKTWIATRGR